ncbi:MAG: ABC transporter permease [Micromonosporaceae bacterium]
MLRATLKGLLHRKLRLALAVIAVVLGVGFVSGANVLTDSLSAGFDKLFATVNQDIAVQVQIDSDRDDTGEPPLLTDTDLEKIEAVDGVAEVDGDVSSQGLIPFHAETGKAVQVGGAPALGFGLDPDDLRDPDSVITLAEGELPDADGEVALTRRTARMAGVEINDTLKVYVPREQKAREFTVVGTLKYSGDRDSLGGELAIGFTVPEAQRLFYGEEGVYSGAAVIAEDGVTDTALKKRVAEVIPGAFTARTGEEVAAEQSSQIKEGLGFINWFFLAFGLIALLVGIFLIFNTFNIVVAQRSRELALYRALGASRRQVTFTTLVEALIVGLVGSGLGLLFGVGLAAGLRGFFALVGIELPDGGLVVSLSSVLIALATGVGVTMVAALAPAIRASAVPPVAAMRDVVKPDKPLRWLVVSGLVLVAGGAVAFGFALRGLGEATLPVMGLGVLLVFLGTALLSPVLTRPLAGVLGWLLSWGEASKLGRRNALRNPRRTAVTAAALMIGVTLVSALTMLGASFKSTVLNVLNDQRGADVIINTMNTQAPTGKEGFTTESLQKVAALDGVQTAVPVYASVAKVDGEDGFVGATDLGDAKQLFAVTAKQGEVRDLADGEFAVDEQTAKDNGWRVGDQITITFAKGGDRGYELVGIYDSELGMSGVIVDSSVSRFFAGQLANQAYLKLSPGTDSDAVVKDVEKLMADYPMVSVADRSDMVKQINDQIDLALNIFNGLLVLAVLIAFLGILNTLLLSIYERTRELGMLRAIGMARKQVKRMIRVESVIMTVFGCLLGIGLGLALGYAVASTLVDLNQLTTITLPGAELLVFVAVAVVAGLVAAWWPAFRASRLNVLEAIAYE